jgi:hypothetical protein
MNLFDDYINQNLLPQDGQVIYFGVIFEPSQHHHLSQFWRKL